MQASLLNRIPNFIWSVADDALRDLYFRGKYRDVILPMTVLRRLDAVLEPASLYNPSPFTLWNFAARASQQQLLGDFIAYLDGFSPNVPDILDKFEFHNQLNRLS